ncbi:protein-L-isoaspartate(D-aspartate) O-methyltransferase [Oscillatoria amoena NRMC-F 0135]|nr:protein-L-isoaspartate(D-aspartate) O-methyltransferase [Oscillatoria amoena NRMC-F 0135]
MHANVCLVSGFILSFFVHTMSISQDYNALRNGMVEKQLKARGIKSDAVLNAMHTVERHLFVPKNIRTRAYDDGPLPIGEGQTISQPYIVAFMTEVLNVKSTDRILEIGTGSGYQAAILAELCREVYTIELEPVLGNRADSVLRKLGYSNVFIRIGDGYAGWPEAAPFDAIIVTCSPSHIPKPLEEQLKEGGRMIIPVGEASVQELVLVIRQDGKLKKQSRLPVLFVPMRDRKGKRY